MRPLRFQIFLLPLLVGLASCDQSFDPRGTQPRQLVVYSIFSTDRSQLFVRVEHDYLPQEYDPLSDRGDKSVTGATVLLSVGNTAFTLRDTVLRRDDQSRYAIPIRCYVINPFAVENGKLYALRVQLPGYATVLARLTIPSKLSLAIDPLSNYVLDYPTQNPPGADILFPMTLGTTTKGYLARLLVDYDVSKNGEWMPERSEIPVSYAYSGLKDMAFVAYGRVMPRPSNGRTSGWYRNELYSKTLAKISDTYRSTRLIFTKIVFQVVQMDPHLYNYYVVSHMYDDPHSIRLDEPLYTNINGGVGVVGAYALDSLMHLLPENFAFNR